MNSASLEKEIEEALEDAIYNEDGCDGAKGEIALSALSQFRLAVEREALEKIYEFGKCDACKATGKYQLSANEKEETDTLDDIVECPYCEGTGREAFSMREYILKQLSATAGEPKE